MHLVEVGRVESTHPWVGILAVMLAAFVSTLSSRLTNFGIADIGAALGASVDERAWIPTSFSVAQMLMGPIAVWLGLVYGPRRVLIVGAIVFGFAELFLPMSTSLNSFLVLHFIAGLGSGTFVPLAIGVVVRNLPKAMLPLGISVYAMNLELSLNIAATLEGWHIDHGGWQWIFWQNLPLVLGLIVCVYFGIPREPTKLEVKGKGDFWGMAFAGLGFSVIYAALDQGNRLDWLSSGLIVGLLVSGAILLLAFIVHGYRNPNAFIDFKFLTQRNIIQLVVLLTIGRLLVLSSNFIVPQFLTQVAGFRPQQVGEILLWVALPQFIIGPLVGVMLRYVDARVTLVIGMSLVIVACLAASQLTSQWSETEFVPSMLMQAVGQTMFLTSLIYFMVRHLNPIQVITFGAVVQIARLMGGELASALIQTYTRVSAQIHSNLLGIHVMSGDSMVSGRIAGFSQGALTRFGILDPANTPKAIALLSGQVGNQAATLAYSDSFLLAAATAALGLVVIMSLRSPPT
ncbi:MFS transporter [Pseudomonas sp. NA-150]|uniref:MFS transporter n=1 Tax=Pseudomonas sp. NA-150 TaxID=3367525 RepID=UPI0037C9EBC3